MPKLLFLARVAFICNICFVFAFLLRYYAFVPQGALSSTLIILGFFLGVVINVLLHFTYACLLVTRNFQLQYFPYWLIIANFLFFVSQIILLVA